MDYPKYQWSMFSPNRSKQFVVRSDSWDEIIEGIDLAKNKLPKSEAFPDDSGKYATPVEKTQETTPVCPKHHKAMTYGKFGWYCQSKDESAPKGWCTYKPPKA